MTDDYDHTDRVNRLLRAAFGQQNEGVMRSIIEHVTGLDVIDYHRPGDRGEIEVWFGGAGALTGDELGDLQALFEVKEVGVYGDPLLAGTEEDNGLEGRFHAILKPAPGSG